MQLHDQYDTKDRGYYQNIRQEIVKLVPPGTQRLLEIGCGEGATALCAKETYSIPEVMGVESNPRSAEIAASRLDRVICGDIESVDMPFPDDYFDAIVCGDVLEHLIDPWKTLQRLVRHLRIGGVVIASIPNIAYWSVVKSIMLDRFQYEESGILDRTHLRFFTRSTINALMQSAGLEVMSWNVNDDVHRGQLWWRMITLGLHKHANVVQFLSVARKR